LTSPTTTDRDKRAAERMARWAFVGGSALNKESIRSYGEKILAAGAGLSARAPRDVVTSDMKIYKGGIYQFAIAQVEVSNLYELNGNMEVLNNALTELRESKGLNFAMLMVTDVVRGSSRLIVSNPPPILDNLPYEPQPDKTWLAEGVVSRKKQLLPVVLGLLEA
jgi:manganese-dependent inorganic pyrophosphatase